jgi:hypothetical protein
LTWRVPPRRPCPLCQLAIPWSWRHRSRSTRRKSTHPHMQRPVHLLGLAQPTRPACLATPITRLQITLLHQSRPCAPRHIPSRLGRPDRHTPQSRLTRAPTISQILLGGATRVIPKTVPKGDPEAMETTCWRSRPRRAIEAGATTVKRMAGIRGLMRSRGACRRKHTGRSIPRTRSRSGTSECSPKWPCRLCVWDTHELTDQDRRKTFPGETKRSA